MATQTINVSDTTYTVNIQRGASPMTNGVYDVTLYGAVGDGTTDDTAAIQAAIDACESAGGGTIYFPPNTYRTTATLTVENTDLDAFFRVNLGQATVEADSGLAGPILRLGGNAAQHANIDLVGGHLKMDSRDWTDTVGLQLNNLYTSRIDDVKVSGCEKGIELSSITTADGTAYNTISFRHILDCLYGLYLESDQSGWVNENCFYGDGRVAYSSSLAAVDCSAGAGIYAKPVDYGGTSTYAMNSHSFFGLSLEFSAGDTYDGTNGYVRPKAVDIEASFCTFAGVRTEGWTRVYDITGATAASPCVVTLDTTKNGFRVGDTAYIRNIAGMTELDGAYTIEAVSDTTVSLTVDASGFTAYSSGGNADQTEWLNFDANSKYNIWYGGREALVGARLASDQVLRCNFLGSRGEQVLSGGSDDAPALAARTSSSSYQAFATYNANSTDPRFLVAGDGGATVYSGTSAMVALNPDASINLRPVTGASVTEAEGSIYYDSDDDFLKLRGASAWEQMFSSANFGLYEGSGSPEGGVTANPGSLYIDTDGGAGVTLYVKESGVGNTGWVAK